MSRPDGTAHSTRIEAATIATPAEQPGWLNRQPGWLKRLISWLRRLIDWQKRWSGTIDLDQKSTRHGLRTALFAVGGAVFVVGGVLVGQDWQAEGEKSYFGEV
jgi:hypothetical protein